MALCQLLVSADKQANLRLAGQAIKVRLLLQQVALRMHRCRARLHSSPVHGVCLPASPACSNGRTELELGHAYTSCARKPQAMVLA